MANSVDPDQTAPIGAVCSGSTLFASILNISVKLGSYLQQATSADNILTTLSTIFPSYCAGKLSYYTVPGQVDWPPSSNLFITQTFFLFV